MRIVSLLPGATEIVAALGFAGQLVGRSHECDFPHAVTRVPVVSRPRIDIGAPGAAIDRSIRTLVTKGLSIYEIDAERLRELAPDVIVTQTQCEVCAVSERDVVDAVCSWVGRKPRLVSLNADRLAGVHADIGAIARALGDEAAGQRVSAALAARLDAIRKATAGLGDQPSLACIEWIDPLMGAGNWMPELVETAGGRNLFGAAGEHSPWLDWETLAASHAECILVAPCGFDIARTRGELGALATDARWRALHAVRAGRVYVADGHQYFNRPGPRLADSAEILAEILHPGRFDFGHEGVGWVRA
ncbi:MAG: cobalamin-binding protein [Gammaproteobacteria bacterium]|nr:cobalamin-binding protein [Gammaproteobacteria bacterium]